MEIENNNLVRIRNIENIPYKIRHNTGKVKFVGKECLTVDFGFKLPHTIERKWVLKVISAF